MELAGLSCAQALAKTFPANTHKRVMVTCGPGNQVSPAPGVLLAGHESEQESAVSRPQNMSCSTQADDLQGGDGLVAARHLHLFNYKPTVYLPKPGSKDIYQRLLKQVENLHIPVLKSEQEFEKSLKNHDVILDAIFGTADPSSPLSRDHRLTARFFVCTTSPSTLPYRSPSAQAIKTPHSVRGHTIGMVSDRRTPTAIYRARREWKD